MTPLAQNRATPGPAATPIAGGRWPGEAHVAKDVRQGACLVARHQSETRVSFGRVWGAGWCG